MSKKKILAGILLTVMVLTSAIPAFAAETVCTHPEEALDWAYPYKKKPTCQETGLTDEICTICGAVVHIIFRFVHFYPPLSCILIIFSIFIV